LFQADTKMAARALIQAAVGRVQCPDRIINCLESEVCTTGMEIEYWEEQMARYGKAAAKSVRSAPSKAWHA
jgi:hypothetical protein